MPTSQKRQQAAPLLSSSDDGTSQSGLEEGAATYGATTTADPHANHASVTPIVRPPPLPSLSPFHICCILSTAFCYGCIATTMFLLVLPIECLTIELKTRGTISKSVALGAFAAIAGASQLVCPLVGMLSDRYHPGRKRKKRRKRKQNREQSRRASDDTAESGIMQGPAEGEKEAERWVKGRRMPYLLVGSGLTEIGLIGIDIASAASSYTMYTVFFVLAMIGINVVYCVMIALIPDLIPHEQTGLANGTLALLLVSGSLFGFAMFKLALDEGVHAMYLIYMAVTVIMCAVTFLAANDLSGKKDEYILHLNSSNGIATNSSTVSNTVADGNERMNSSPEHHAEPSLASTLSALLSLGIIPTLQNMIVKPLRLMTFAEIRHAYWVDPADHHDFFVVTLSRLFYYLGLSAQCFFLYFIHDVLHERNNPEAAASMLAMITTAAGAVTCYPVGIISDRCFGGRRKPFVYGACAVLALSNISLLWCTTIRQMGIICAVLGAANGVYLTMDTSLAVDTLDVSPEDEEEMMAVSGENGEGNDKKHKAASDNSGNHDGAAQLLGIWGVAGFIGSALGPLVGGPLLFYFGSNFGTRSTISPEEGDDGSGGYSWEGYAVVLTLSGLYFACSAATLQWITDHNL